MDARKVTAYCGLCCLDCIPNNRRLIELAREMADLMDQVGFEHYAAHKTRREPAFEHYEQFRQVLDAIPRLECSGSCYEGPVSELGCARDCSLRRCCIEHRLAGCWECGKSDDCESLRRVIQFHPGLETNLCLIREVGIEGWLDERAKHYWWQYEPHTDAERTERQQGSGP